MSFLFYNKRIQKSLLALIIVTTLFTFIPEKTRAYWGVLDINVTETPNTISAGISSVANPTTAVMTTADKIKNYVIDPAARFALKMIIKKVDS